MAMRMDDNKETGTFSGAGGAVAGAVRVAIVQRSGLKEVRVRIRLPNMWYSRTQEA